MHNDWKQSTGPLLTKFGRKYMLELYVPFQNEQNSSKGRKKMFCDVLDCTLRSLNGEAGQMMKIIGEILESR